MDRLTENKIVLITRETRIDELVARFNTLRQAQFYVESLAADFSDYLEEHDNYYKALGKAKAILERLGRLQITPRKYLPNFLFGPKDTVVALGQDGLVANTVKYAKSLPVMGVNPDPARWDGVLLPFQVYDLEDAVMELFSERREINLITMAKAQLNNGQVLYAVNDLFIGVKSHTSVRYKIQTGGKRESHSSSGVIVSTGLGSTGWYKSLMTGAISIAAQTKGADLEAPEDTSFPWDSQFLRYTVREPFPSRTSSASIVHGDVTRVDPLIMVSLNAENGVIFSDGIENDFLDFNSGTKASITLAQETGLLVV